MKDREKSAMNRENRREHVRVDCALKVDCQRLSTDDYRRFRDNPEFIFKKTLHELPEIPEIDEVTLDVLYRLIYETNLKMDRILELLERQDGTAHASVRADCVNISGAGLKCITNRRFSIGDIVALRIFLPVASRTQIQVLGRVTSSEESQATDDYHVVISFVDIPEGDRDTIIGYVFNRQRELLKRSFDASHDK